MHDDIEKMKTNHIGLVVLVNRYDGIDLPHDACRVLVIDGLPDSRRLIDKVIESQLQGSSKAINQKIQKIEQGMGRGVRSNDDFCVVFLMGKYLISHLYKNGSIDKFSSATKAQFELSEQLSEQLKETSLQEINKAVESSLNRDEGWVIASKSRLASLSYIQNDSDNFSIAQRLAYNEACINQYDSAVRILNDAIDASDKIVSGFSKQILAEYINYKNEVEAQNLLTSAIRDNRNILKPKEGITYERIKTVDEQARTFQHYISTHYSSEANKFIIDIDAILEDLIFRPETANKFEEAIKKLAFMLGFEGQRPENEYGRGPDNLWSVGNNKHFIIECKNGVINPLINKHDMNQLNGSIAWFTEKYDHSMNYTPIMIHLGNICEYGATPLKGCVAMRKEKLELLKKNIKEFSVAVKTKINQLDEIKKLLIHYKLRDSDIVQEYTDEIKIKS